MYKRVHEFFETTTNRSSFPLYEFLQKGCYVRKIIRFQENYDRVYILVHDRVIYPQNLY